MTNTRASVTRTQRDEAGNAGLIEEHGSYPTVEQAKGRAEALGRRYYPTGKLHWKQFSPTTWGLMCGQVYTSVLVSLLTKEH